MEDLPREVLEEMVANRLKVIASERSERGNLVLTGKIASAPLPL